jgi:hypothetical protein
LYDLQDCPPELEGLEEPVWAGLVLKFVLQVHTSGLPEQDTTAQELAEKVCLAWKKFCSERQKSLRAAEQKNLQFTRLENQIRTIKNRIAIAVMVIAALALLGSVFGLINWMLSHG